MTQWNKGDKDSLSVRHWSPRWSTHSLIPLGWYIVWNYFVWEEASCFSYLDFKPVFFFFFMMWNFIYHKIWHLCHLKTYNVMTFYYIHNDIRQSPLFLSPEYLHHPKRKPCTQEAVTPHSLLFSNPGNHYSSFSLYGFACSGHFITKIVSHLASCVWLLSPSTILSRVIHVVAGFST